MRKKKDLKEVISRQEVEVLTLEEQLAEANMRASKFQTENELLQKKMERYKFLAKAHRKALTIAKQDRSHFAKKYTELEQKVIPKGLVEKLLFLLKN